MVEQEQLVCGTWKTRYLFETTAEISCGFDFFVSNHMVPVGDQ